MSPRGLVLMLMVIMVLFEPGVNAIGVGVRGSGIYGSFSDGLKIDATEDSSAFVHSTIGEGTLSQSFSGTGTQTLEKTFTADNNLGEKAEINFDVKKAKTLNYNQNPIIQTDATSASLTGFYLTAIDAKKIECTTAASNIYEDKASVSIQVDDGSLADYKPSVYVQANSDHSAIASQHIGFSAGKKIELNAEASDKEEHNIAEASTEVSKGSIANYDSEAICGSTISQPYPDLYAIQGAFTPDLKGYVSGKEITSEGSAIGPSNLKASYKTTIKDGTISGFFDQGTQLINNEAIAISLEAPANWGDWQVPPYDEMKDNSVTAKEIKFKSSASYGSGIKSSESTIASNVYIQNWLGSGSFASPGKAWTEKLYDVLSGSKIKIT